MANRARLSLLQTKSDVNRQLNWVWLAVEISRLVLPLLHGVERSRDQYSGAADGVFLDDVAVLVDHRVDLNIALDSRFLREDRIFGLRRVNQARGLDGSADLKRAGWGSRRRRRRRSGEPGSTESAADDAAEYPTDLTAWNSTGDASGNTGDEVRRSFGGVLLTGIRNGLRYGDGHGQLGGDRRDLLWSRTRRGRGCRRRRRRWCSRQRRRNEVRQLKLLRIDGLGEKQGNDDDCGDNCGVNRE